MDMTKKWILEIVAMFCVMLGCFKASAKDFKYEVDGNKWEYYEEDRQLYLNYKWPDGDEYHITTFDVSEEDAWKIIKGEEFPTFEFSRSEYCEHGDWNDDWSVSKHNNVYTSRMPCRDYTNRR